VKELSNIFSDLPDAVDKERTETLLSTPNARIERITSKSQSSPPGFWYDQQEKEFILLLRGEAGLRFEDESQPRHLKAGDILDIAAHRRHRVDWTAPDQETVWLAVFISD